MRHLILALTCALAPSLTLAQAGPDLTRDIVENHIRPRMAMLDQNAQQLTKAAALGCDPNSQTLRAAYGAAFDAWVGVSHLRFGPSEYDNRGFALAFWPDSRGATPKALAALIRAEDPIAQTAQSYAEVSIAARGYYALEFLLYDQALQSGATTPYLCTLIQTVTADIADVAAQINADWQTTYATRLSTPDPQGTYRTTEEALQELFKALSTGLEFTADTRLGRPLGTFERPRPKRAEAWRSGRSSQQVAISLTALRDISRRLAQGDEPLVAQLDRAFEQALSELSALNDPIFAGVAQPQKRFKIEILQQSINSIRALVRDELGPKLGVAIGFNALDGD